MNSKNVQSLLRHDAAGIRAWALQNLDRDGLSREERRDLIIGMLLDKHEDVRVTAFEELYGHDVRPHAGKVLRYARRFPEDYGAENALRCVVGFGNSSERREALALLTNVGPSDSRIEAFLALPDTPIPDLPDRVRRFREECDDDELLALVPMLLDQRNTEESLAWQLTCALLHENPVLWNMVARSEHAGPYLVMISRSENPYRALSVAESQLGVSADLGFLSRHGFSKARYLIESLAAEDPVAATPCAVDEFWNEILVEYGASFAAGDAWTRQVAGILSRWDPRPWNSDEDLLRFLIALRLGCRHRAALLARMAAPPGSFREALDLAVQLPVITPKLLAFLKKFPREDVEILEALEHLANFELEGILRPDHLLELMTLFATASLSGKIVDFCLWSDNSDYGEWFIAILSSVEERSPGAVFSEIESRLAALAEDAEEFEEEDLLTLLLRLPAPQTAGAMRKYGARMIELLDHDVLIELLHARGDEEALRLLLDIWTPDDIDAAAPALALWELLGRPASIPIPTKLRRDAREVATLDDDLFGMVDDSMEDEDEDGYGIKLVEPEHDMPIARIALDDSPLTKTVADSSSAPGAAAPPKTGRNERCPCGSGKKYKKCCLPKEETEKRSTWRSVLTFAEKRVLVERSGSLDVARCLINSGWRESGLASILVVRRQPDGLFTFAVFLVDLQCLGVKSAFCNANSTHEEIETLVVSRAFAMGGTEAIGLYTAREIIEGAVEYAAELGFEPDPDYKLARRVLGDDEYQRTHRIHFGGPEGKPLFVVGPNDDCRKIMKKLRARLGDDGFHFLGPMDSF